MSSPSAVLVQLLGDLGETMSCDCFLMSCDCFLMSCDYCCTFCTCCLHIMYCQMRTAVREGSEVSSINKHTVTSPVSRMQCASIKGLSESRCVYCTHMCEVVFFSDVVGGTLCSVSPIPWLWRGVIPTLHCIRGGQVDEACTSLWLPCTLKHCCTDVCVSPGPSHRVLPSTTSSFW